jgi:hypothetical protein
MGYYLRVFCKSADVPSLIAVRKYIESLAKGYEIEDDNQYPSAWSYFSFYYKKKKFPVLIEVNKLSDDDALAKEEIEEFIEEIGSAFFSLAKRKIINHLKGSTFTVAAQLPVSDIEDDGIAANQILLSYFIENCEGLMQIDGEGFYFKDKLIWKYEGS